MFGPRGLPRAERELARSWPPNYGCADCASVHAKRLTELTKTLEVMQCIEKDGVEAMLEPAPASNRRLRREAHARPRRASRPRMRRRCARRARDLDILV